VTAAVFSIAFVPLATYLIGKYLDRPFSMGPVVVAKLILLPVVLPSRTSALHSRWQPRVVIPLLRLQLRRESSEGASRIWSSFVVRARQRSFHDPICSLATQKAGRASDAGPPRHMKALSTAPYESVIHRAI